jgi:type IV secretory pathway TrbD component
MLIGAGELLILAALFVIGVVAFAVAVLVLLARRRPPQVVVVMREPDGPG